MSTAGTSLESLVPDSKWEILAGLRFLLAMVVVFWHLPWFSPPGPRGVFSELGGTAAVLGFLVISGYSIAQSVAQRPVGFFRRRFLRIYPLYTAAVLFSLLPFVSGADALASQYPDEVFSRPHAWVVVGNLLILQNLVCPAIDSDLVVWTLGVEVMCYLAAPLLRNLPSYALVAAILISGGAFAMYPQLHLRHYATLMWGIPLMLFAWAWLAGFLLHRYRTSIWFAVAIAVFGAILQWLNTAFPARYSILTFAFAITIIAIAGKVPVPRSMRPLLNYLGDLSYPLYLFHLPSFLIGYCIMGFRSPAGLLTAALLVSAAFLLLESILKPLLRVKKQFRH